MYSWSEWGGVGWGWGRAEDPQPYTCSLAEIWDILLLYKVPSNERVIAMLRNVVQTKARTPFCLWAKRWRCTNHRQSWAENAFSYIDFGSQYWHAADLSKTHRKTHPEMLQISVPVCGVRVESQFPYHLPWQKHTWPTRTRENPLGAYDTKLGVRQFCHLCMSWPY